MHEAGKISSRARKAGNEAIPDWVGGGAQVDA
jgi:hypothetical protein